MKDRIGRCFQLSRSCWRRLPRLVKLVAVLWISVISLMIYTGVNADDVLALAGMFMSSILIN